MSATLNIHHISCFACIFGPTLRQEYIRDTDGRDTEIQINFKLYLSHAKHTVRSGSYPADDAITVNVKYACLIHHIAVVSRDL